MIYRLIRLPSVREPKRRYGVEQHVQSTISTTSSARPSSTRPTHPIYRRHHQPNQNLEGTTQSSVNMHRCQQKSPAHQHLRHSSDFQQNGSTRPAHSSPPKPNPATNIQSWFHTNRPVCRYPRIRSGTNCSLVLTIWPTNRP